jgi:hypothetical protein
MYQWHMVNNNKLSLKKNKCILSVKFSYVRFISQEWKYVYDTLNVLLTSHLDSRLWVSY